MAQEVMPHQSVEVVGAGRTGVNLVIRDFRLLAKIGAECLRDTGRLLQRSSVRHVNDDLAKPRVRSMSMNVFLGGWGGTDGYWGPIFSDYLIYLKQQELQVPGPSKVFVFLDMREDSIDMGNFGTRMADRK